MFLWRIVKYDLDTEEQERSSRSGSSKRTAVKVKVRRLAFEVGCFLFFHCSFCICLLFLYFCFYLFCLFFCYQFYQFFLWLLNCFFFYFVFLSRELLSKSAWTLLRGPKARMTRILGGQEAKFHVYTWQASLPVLIIFKYKIVHPAPCPSSRHGICPKFYTAGFSG